MLLDIIPTTWLCTAFIVVFVMCSQGGLAAFEWWYQKRGFPTSNEVGGLMFATQSLIYSLILAFVIVAVWNDYEELSTTIEQEADKLNSIIAHSATLPYSIKKPLDRALTGYCTQIIDKEWRMTDAHSDVQPSAIPDLRLMLLRTKPRNDIERSVYNVIDADLSAISDLRRDRLDHTESHVPPIVWLILKAGSAILVVFSYFLSTPSIILKRIYLLLVSSTIAMSLFLVYALDHPFSGSSQVSYAPYVKVLSVLKNQHISPNN